MTMMMMTMTMMTMTMMMMMMMMMMILYQVISSPTFEILPPKVLESFFPKNKPMVDGFT